MKSNTFKCFDFKTKYIKKNNKKVKTSGQSGKSRQFSYIAKLNSFGLDLKVGV